MKKSTIINISGIAFYLEEEAYKKLDAYLSQLNKHFKDVEDKDEIIEDIENRIAEKFSNTIKNSQSVITLEAVESIIKSMGMPEEFEDEEAEVKNEKAEKNVFANRKLFRDPDNKMIGGVISGFVAYFGIPEKYTQFIRLAIVIILLLDFLNASWIIVLTLYIFAYLSIPEAESVTDRVEMRGKPITLANIQSTIATDLEESEKKISKRKKILLFPFKVIGKVLAFIKWFFKYCLSKIIGLFVIGISMALFIGTTWLAIMVAFFKDSPLIDTPLKTFPDNGLEYTTVTLIYIFILLPILFAIILGISILKRRYVLKSMATFSFLGVWILSFFVGGSLLFNSMPEIRQNYENSRLENTKTYNLDSFERIILNGNSNGALNVRIYKSDDTRLVIQGNEKMVKYDVKNSELTLEELNVGRICVLCYDDTQIEIYTPKVLSINTQNSVIVSVNDMEGLEDLTVSSTNYSSVYLKGSSKKLNVNLRGGNSYLQAFDFKVDELKIFMYDSTAEVSAKDKMITKLEQDALLVYRGEPEIVKGSVDSRIYLGNTQILREDERRSYHDRDRD